MPTPHISDIIRSLTFDKKLLAVGSILMVLSLFFPWYVDADSFRISTVFIGLNGPLYLVGLTFLVLSSITLMFLVMDYFNKKMPLFAIKPSKFYVGFGLASFYLLMIVNTVYFDKNFGVNIAMKQSGFGMFMAFIAAALITIGGYMSTRERTSILRNFEEETKAKVSMPSVDLRNKPRENLRQSISHPTTNTAAVNTFMDRVEREIKQPAMSSEPQNVPADNRAENKETPTQPYRMDL